MPTIGEIRKFALNSLVCMDKTRCLRAEIADIMLQRGQPIRRPADESLWLGWLPTHAGGAIM